MKLSDKYLLFYLEGREAKMLKADIDTEAVAEEVEAGKGSIHELLHKAVSDAARAEGVDRAKRRWIAEYEDEIKDAGGDGELAYQHYVAGRVDELVHRLDGEVVDFLAGDEDDDEEEEEGDEDETAEGK